jgi:hypothetical protein
MKERKKERKNERKKERKKEKGDSVRLFDPNKTLTCPNVWVSSLKCGAAQLHRSRKRQIR